MRTQLLALSLTLVGAGPLTSQDRPVELLGPGTAGRYPEVLHAAGISGTVRLRLVLLPGDTIPRADQVTILSAPHPAFTNATKDLVTGWRVRPAPRGGEQVQDSAEVAVAYEFSRADFFLGATEVHGPTRDSLGVWRAEVTLISLRRAAESLEPTVRDSAIVASIRSVAGGVRRGLGGGAPTVCVSRHLGAGTDPLTSAEWLALQLPSVAMIHPARCPPQFSHMFVVVGQVIPPGADPYHLVVTGAEAWAEGWVVVHISLGQGTGGDYYDCAVRRTSPSTVVRCRSDRSWVS